MDKAIESPAELLKRVGEAMRRLRVQRQLTQRDLASKADVSPQSIAKLERAEGSTLETLVRALHALKATEFIENLAPRARVSPIELLRADTPRQRVRRSGPRPA
jgi:transcriptional regulator with XRE-family HTH domain